MLLRFAIVLLPDPEYRAGAYLRQGDNPLELYEQTDDKITPYLEWKPKGTANISDSVSVHQGTVSGRVEPFSLNEQLAVGTLTNHDLMETYYPGQGAFSLTYIPPDGQENLWIKIKWEEIVTATVPEPGTLLLFLTSTASLILFRCIYPAGWGVRCRAGATGR